MILDSYKKIEDLEVIAKVNNIEVPRLRVYRLMKDEKPFSKKEIDNIKHNMEHLICEEGCTSYPRFTPDNGVSEFSPATDRLLNKYMSNEDGEFRWNLLHGKARNRMKYAVKRVNRAVDKQYDMWNKYAGKENILYIHARIGGGNWIDYRKEVENQPWFLEKVDDHFDPTYCDIYAKIK